MKDQLPWTDSGLECLELIQKEIRTAGGRRVILLNLIQSHPSHYGYSLDFIRRLRSKITDSEKQKRKRQNNPHPVKWTEAQENYLINHFVPARRVGEAMRQYRAIGAKLSRSPMSVKKKYHELVNRGLASFSL